MNRLFFLFLSLFLAAAVTYFLSGHLEKYVDPALLLPDDTLVYADIKKPAENHRKFKHSRLGRQIYSIKWTEMLQALDVPSELVEDLSRRYKRFEEIFESRLFHELCGRRATLALLPLSGNSGSDKRPSDLLSSLVFISRPNHKASLLDLFSFPFLRDYEYESENYLGKEIRTFTINNTVHISTAVSDGFFVTAFSPDVVKHCLDQSMKSLTGGKSGLLQNPDYTSFKRRTKDKDDQFLYVDLVGLRAFFSASTYEKSERGLHDIEKQSGSYLYQSMCFFRRSRKDKVNFTSILRFDRSKLAAGGGAALYPAPEVISFLPDVPADLLAFYWSNIFDLSALVRGLRHDEQSVAGQLLLGIDNWVSSKTDISFDKFLKLFGSRFAMNISEVWTDGFLPMPKLCFYFEVHSRDEVAQIMEKLVSGLLVKTSYVSGTEVYSVHLAGGLIQPAYAFKDNYLVIADSQKQMQVILEKNKPSLTSDPLFKSVDIGMTQPNNMVAFFKNRELATALKEIAVWAGTLLAINDQNQGVRTKIIIDQVILPILDGAEMYRAKGTRLFSTESELVMQSALLIDDQTDEGE